MTSSSVVTDMNLGQDRCSSQSGRCGRRKTKCHESNKKKDKQPRRGMGVAQLERVRLQTEGQYTYHPQLPPFNPNVAVQYRPLVPVHVPNHQVMFVHGSNLYQQNHVMGPCVIGSGANGGYRFENGNNLKCACGVCHKKMRINGGGCNASLVQPVSSFGRKNIGGSSGQVTASGSMTTSEYEFFPGKGGRGEDWKDMLSMGSERSSTWCASGASVGGGFGFRGGEGSCVTAITGGEEGSVSSVDLSLKLSY